jgi:peptidoglycan biosynthesis protein MviN/MurJ (putative lipid II flippase)
MPIPQPYLTVASILSGFGISVFMFRIQRELHVRDEHPEWPNWLAWADYLILAAILLSLLLVVLPLTAIAEPGRLIYSVAAGGCAAASLLVAAYPFAILDHYRIELGTWRTREGERPQERHKGEPVERRIVLVAAVLATAAFLTVVVTW